METKGQHLMKFMDDFTVIDFETTGRGILPEDITEIAAIRYRDGTPVASFSSLIQAGRPILPFVETLTGIDDQMLVNAPSIDAIIESFVEFIGKDVILGHNVEFDYRLANDAYFQKTGKRLMNHYIDTLKLSRKMELEIANHKLETLCEFFGVTRDIAHRGLEDSRQTADVYLHLKALYVQRLEERRI